MQTNDRMFESEDGSLEFRQCLDGSRAGDFYLNTFNAQTGSASTYGVCVREPFWGGGMNEATHVALREVMANKGTHEPDTKMLRVRKPVVLLTDDFGESGQFDYLELSSSPEKFMVQVRHVGDVEMTSGPIAFSDPAIVAQLAALYNAVQRDQTKMVAHQAQKLARHEGYIAQTLSKQNWDEALVGAERYKNDKDKVHDMYFNHIKQAGIFLLKAGIGLPEEIRESWMKEFAALPEVASQISPIVR